MGHSEGINHNIYQAPLAEAEILKVGSCLMAMDGTVPRVDTHCGTVTRDYVECDQITQGNRALVRNTVSIFHLLQSPVSTPAGRQDMRIHWTKGKEIEIGDNNRQA